jgi:hypothetical protein
MEKHKSVITIADNDDNSITVELSHFINDEEVSVADVAKLQATEDDSMVFALAAQMITAAKYIFEKVEEEVKRHAAQEEQEPQESPPT